MTETTPADLTPVQQAVFDKLNTYLPDIVNTLIQSAEKSHTALTDLFVFVYDRAAYHEKVQILFARNPVEEPKPDGVGIVVVPAAHGAIILTAVGLPGLEDGPGTGIGALINGEGLSTRLVVPSTTQPS